MAITRQDVQSKIRAPGLSGRAVCAHGSPRSFGHVEGGAATVYEVGGCSEGFGNLESSLRPAMLTAVVGESLWRVFDAAQALGLAAAAIRADQRVTHCGGAGCERCDDAVAGGPLVKEEGA